MGGSIILSVTGAAIFAAYIVGIWRNTDGFLEFILLLVLIESLGLVMLLLFERFKE